MADQDEATDFRKIIESIARKRGGELLRVFSDFTCMAACALAMRSREDEYLELAKNYSREELTQFGEALGHLVEEMEAHPFEDVLGRHYCEIGSQFSRDMRGEFYTPKPVTDLMARVTVDVSAVIAAGRPITVNEPASGSGGAILSLAECFAKAKAVDLLRVTCQDISKLACDMAYINLTLWGVPARILWGDTIRYSFQKGWLNIHWHRVGEPDRERIARFLALIRELPASVPKVEDGQMHGPGPESVEATKASVRQDNSGQNEWLFG